MKSLSFRKACFALLLLSPFASQCKTSNRSISKALENSDSMPSEKGFDVNDISWLFPVGSDSLPYPTLKAEEFVPLPFIKSVNQEFFERIRDGFLKSSPRPMSEAEKKARSDEFVAKYESYRWLVVAVRYDPCSPTSNPDALAALVAKRVTPGCLQQIRLVLQPFFEQDAGTAHAMTLADDVALHAVYTFKVGAVDSSSPFIADLLRLKEIAEKSGTSLAGRPLDAHPVLSKEMTKPGEAPYTDSLVALLKNFDPMKLTQLAAFSEIPSDPVVQMNGDGLWAFKAGTVGHKQSDGSCSPDRSTGKTVDDLCFFPVNIQVKLDSPTIEVGCGRGLSCGIEPDLTHKDNIGLVLADRGAASGEIVNVIDDPDQHNFFTTDCASCHMTTTAIKTFNIKQGAQRAKAPVGVTPYLAGSLWSRKETWDFRNLGYFNQQPTASTRTALEAAYAADDLNKHLGLKNPGKDCSGKDSAGLSVDQKVWECFRSGKEDCMDLCK